MFFFMCEIYSLFKSLHEGLQQMFTCTGEAWQCLLSTMGSRCGRTLLHQPDNHNQTPVRWKPPSTTSQSHRHWTNMFHHTAQVFHSKFICSIFGSFQKCFLGAALAVTCLSCRSPLWVFPLYFPTVSCLTLHYSTKAKEYISLIKQKINRNVGFLRPDL